MALAVVAMTTRLAHLNGCRRPERCALAPTTVAFMGLSEDAPRAPGTVPRPIPAAPQERTLLVERALVLNSGDERMRRGRSPR